ncbi:hypothetical protein [Streptomyces natalensis]|uniref:Uncharacterized protein n=1 Tax=Streptomyces natalensis ATCC 27448 TaxID=1240678 RepID=A0A0D7CM15_9ACTN|nr:hypothetical protein [Streptomyces natalensis]KIZ16900.1 hypothetical protein SNA_18170 [Streptomyces natalensis ATCC 27448]
MTIRIILRLRRQLAESRGETARIERELRSLDSEITDVRDANTQLRQEAAVALERQVAAMETIDHLAAERERLLAKLEQAINWATEVGRVNACVDRQNQERAADNERLRRELAARTQPIARVIPLQQRGPSAA